MEIDSMNENAQKSPKRLHKTKIMFQLLSEYKQEAPCYMQSMSARFSSTLTIPAYNATKTLGPQICVPREYNTEMCFHGILRPWKAWLQYKLNKN